MDTETIPLSVFVELFYIGIPVVQTDGRRRSVHGHVITKLSGMGRFTYPWCSAGARELCYQ